MKIWSRLHGDMQGRTIKKEVVCPLANDVFGN
jgi:hypothetical protein